MFSYLFTIFLLLEHKICRYLQHQQRKLPPTQGRRTHWGW